MSRIQQCFHRSTVGWTRPFSDSHLQRQRGLYTLLRASDSQTMEMHKCPTIPTTRDPRAIFPPAVKTAEHRWRPTSGIRSKAPYPTVGTRRSSSSVTKRATKNGPQSDLDSTRNPIRSNGRPPHALGISQWRQNRGAQLLR